MANWIDNSYFYGPLTIPQVSQATVQNDLNWFIAMYEKEYLQTILGVALYDALIAGLAAGSPLAKWTDLKARFISIDGSVKISPIANYVYFRYMNSRSTVSTAKGEKTLKAENGIEDSHRYKLADAWNAMRSMNFAIKDWIKASSDYPEYSEPKRVITYDPQVKMAYRRWQDLYRTQNPFL